MAAGLNGPLRAPGGQRGWEGQAVSLPAPLNHLVSAAFPACPPWAVSVFSPTADETIGPRGDPWWSWARCPALLPRPRPSFSGTACRAGPAASFRGQRACEHMCVCARLCAQASAVFGWAQGLCAVFKYQCQGRLRGARQAELLHSRHNKGVVAVLSPGAPPPCVWDAVGRADICADSRLRGATGPLAPNGALRVGGLSLPQAAATGSHGRPSQQAMGRGQLPFCVGQARQGEVPGVLSGPSGQPCTPL